MVGDRGAPQVGLLLRPEPQVVNTERIAEESAVQRVR